VLRIAGLLCGAALALAPMSCGGRAGEKSATAVKLPASGRAYRALDRAQRTAVAASCRDRIAGSARGLAASELRAVDPAALRGQLDADYGLIAEQRRPVADVCREMIPFVTPGLRLGFDGAKDDQDGTFSVETDSGKRLRLSGRVTPAPPGAYVIARRDVGPTVVRRAPIGRDGRFALPAVRLRKVADNTFTITFRAVPHAPRKVLFTAICLDCLSGGPPPGSA
jgi:hypothetical protein